MNTNSVSNRNLSYWLFLAMTACVLMAASVNGQSYVNLLANPQWDPTTTNGTDGGRNWSFSYQNAANRAYQLNDFWGVAHPGSGVGKYGMVKYECGGATAGDFQYARSPWYTANHGSTWTASAWFRTTGGLKGTQQGLLKIVIADSSFNVIASQFVTVVTTNSADVYTLGNVSILAPTNAAYVYMEAGLYNPNAGVGAGVLLVDDASLSCPNQFLPNPGWDPTAAAGNGGRWWTYTYTSPSEGAQQNNDYWGVAREGVASGVMGFLKASVDGTVAASCDLWEWRLGRSTCGQRMRTVSARP